MPSISAIVLNYRNWPGVRSTLESLGSQTRAPDEVVLVDNSAGGPGEVPAGEVPAVELVTAAYNGGYAAGMNLGLEQVTGDLVLMVTHDVVLASTAVEHLEARLCRRSGVGAVGPLIGDRFDPEITYSAGGLRVGRDLLHVGHGQPLSDWAGGPPVTRAWLDGCCVLMRRELLQDTGPLDEGYFMYFEEIDHQMSAAAHGWSFEVIPTAVAWQSSGQRDCAVAYRNRLRLVAKHGSRRDLAAEATSQLRRAVALARRGRRAEARVVARGLSGWMLRRDPRRLL